MTIGIFDSGVGGLGIFREITKLLPKEKIIYLADTKNCPYGEKSIGEIKKICASNTRFLLSKGADIIVVACNTGSTVALEYIRSIFPNIPIVGVVPVVKTASKVTKNKKIGILATKRTIESKYLRDLVEEFCPTSAGFHVSYQAANPLVELIEKQKTKNLKLIKNHLDLFIKEKVDVVALGCTHFPFLRPQIEEIMGSEVKILDSNGAVARQVAKIKSKVKNQKSKGIKYQFFTTGNSDKFQQQINNLIGLKAEKVAKISIK